MALSTTLDSYAAGFEDNVAVIRAAAAALADRFRRAGPDARVPTCPDWSARDLIVHQGIIHRWAAANLRQEPDAADAIEEDAVLATVPDHQLADWLHVGASDLIAVLNSVAADVDALVFLNDAGHPRDFWARRQAHETTIHAVDGLAAVLGRLPTAAESGIGAAVAVDGIDELLCGFFTRGRSKLYRSSPVAVRVAPDDAVTEWTFRAGAEGASVNRVSNQDADVSFTGTAAQLYLGLWNRGDEISSAGDPAVLDHWRAVQQVTWG